MTGAFPQPTTVVTLVDGRAIAADDVGDPEGTPVLYLHGSPDCRLARHPDDGLAAGLGVRLVAVDRPGYGGTDPQPVPEVSAWAGDVVVLLDALGIERCRVAAWSAGAPWAVGLAASLPDRVERVVTYGALPPIEAFADAAVAAASGARTGIAEEVAAGTTIDDLVASMGGLLVPSPPVDHDLAREVVLEAYSRRARAEVESVPGMLDQLARSLAAAVDRHGHAGVGADFAVQFGAPLGGTLAAVRCPVVLVHGEHDPIAGPAVGRWLADRLPDATLEMWTGRGHQGLLPDWERWLTLVL